MIDYRKFTGPRQLRLILLSGLSWFPDKFLVRLQYFLQTGKRLHLKNPLTFNEKLQAYKLFYRDPRMLRCTDKVELRKYVEEKGLGDILVPVLGIYNRPEDIDFETLPEKFVIKTSDGGGGNEVYICEQKTEASISEIKSLLKKWSQTPKPRKHIAREWAYDNGCLRKYIVEPLLEEKGKKDIDDYKLYCFQGKFKFLQWHKNRRGPNHLAAHYDAEGNFLPEVFIYYPTFEKAEKLPENFEKMVEYAEKLSQDFPFVRVDLYNVDGKIYLSELTFYPASGYFTYEPDYVDKYLGDFLNYPFRTLNGEKKLK